MYKEAVLWKTVDGNNVLCCLCAHRCAISPGRNGRCKVRKNIDGKLFALTYGRIIAENIDPIEKKPLYHFYPGSYAYSIASFGCNFKCSFCQNWQISQAEIPEGREDGKISPGKIVEKAKKASCGSISYTYTEPTVFFEFAYDTAKLAKEEGIKNSFVTNGFMTEEALNMITPYLDAANVDLKFFNEKSYEEVCGGRLQPVLDTIKRMKKAGIWIEVTTLIVPGKNDSDEEIRDIAAFLAKLDKGIPWHISRFHPDYKEMNTPPTPDETIKKAMEIGKEEGLLYVYPGNTPFSADTVCPGCGTVLVNRQGFSVSGGERIKDGKCGECGSKINGVWG